MKNDFSKEELELIKKALTQVMEERINKVESLPDAPFTPSEEFEQKMQALIKEHKKAKESIAGDTNYDD